MLNRGKRPCRSRINSTNTHAPSANGGLIAGRPAVMIRAKAQGLCLAARAHPRILHSGLEPISLWPVGVVDLAAKFDPWRHQGLAGARSLAALLLNHDQLHAELLGELRFLGVVWQHVPLSREMSCSAKYREGSL